MVAVYSRFNPRLVKRVPSILQEHAGRHAALRARLVLKYGDDFRLALRLAPPLPPPPPPPGAAAAAAAADAAFHAPPPVPAASLATRIPSATPSPKATATASMAKKRQQADYRQHRPERGLEEGAGGDTTERDGGGRTRGLRSETNEADERLGTRGVAHTK